MNGLIGGWGLHVLVFRQVLIDLLLGMEMCELLVPLQRMLIRETHLTLLTHMSQGC